MPTRVCAVSFKECWQDQHGRWNSSGGFPLQMRAIASMFDSMTLLVTQREQPGDGGLALPAEAEVVVLRKPVGEDFRRKVSIVAHLPYYLKTIGHHVRSADVVHVPPPGDIPLLGMLVGLILRKRLLVRYCGSWLPTARTTIMNRVTRTLIRLFAGGRNVMLATGAGVCPPSRDMNWVFASAHSEKDLSAFPANLNRGLECPPRLVYAGRLSPEKGVACLIKALGILSVDKSIKVLPHLDILGEGPERNRLAQLAEEKGCAHLISFCGQVTHSEVMTRLLTADICVLPSLSESYCKARLDAMLCGVPVLTTDVGFGREIVGEDGERGWVISPGDVENLAATLKQVLKSSLDWKELRRRCRNFAESRTLESWTQTIGQVCASQWRAEIREGKLVF